MHALREPLSDDAVRVAGIMYSQLVKSREWPIADFVRRTARREGIDFDRVVTSVPRVGQPGYGPFWTGGFGSFVQSDRPVALTVAGLAQLPAAYELAEVVVRVVHQIAHQYEAVPPNPRAPLTMMLRWADLVPLVREASGSSSKDTMDLVTAVLAHEPAGWGSDQLGREPSELTWSLSDLVGEFADIEGVDAYLERVADVLEPTVHATWNVSPSIMSPVPESASPRSTVLDEIFDSALWSSLDPLVRGGDWDAVVWKAMAVFEDELRRATGLASMSLSNMVGKAFTDIVPLGVNDHPGEAAGWRKLAEGLVSAVRNPTVHGELGADRVYAFGVVGAVSLLLTELRREHPSRFDASTPAVRD